MIKSINKLNITYYNRINNKIYIVLKSLFTKHYACSNMTNVMKLTCVKRYMQYYLL